ncbi:PilZ domain-containing protein [Exiguobacterium sp. MER 193]|uniref:PilZ domain-containing protein n=1 Tax=Exiguobacterium sp. MER 193 TaxID=2939564 RepID=UPI00203E6D07|nr:PilZ domain-containing protein [Exiguobacterium sp. MER 193]MCM3281309.1 PilZ domain-containing protein [Exiguobacterium sp. MER 193]
MRYRRQETFRYILPNPRTISYRLVWEEKELYDGEGLLLNVSSHGLKLRSDYLFPLSEDLQVHFLFDLVPTLQPIELIGHVRHRGQMGSLYDYGIMLDVKDDETQQLVTMIKTYARENK